MWGFTLLPRKVFPTILWDLISMNASSLESRFTIMTTDVGSATFTSAACTFVIGSTVYKAALNAQTATKDTVTVRIRFVLSIVFLLSEIKSSPEAGCPAQDIQVSVRFPVIPKSAGHGMTDAVSRKG